MPACATLLHLFCRLQISWRPHTLRLSTHIMSCASASQESCSMVNVLREAFKLFLTDSVHGFPLVWSELFFFIVIVIRPISLICLSDSVHFAASSGTRSIDICHTASVRDTMKLVFRRKLGSAEDMEHQFHSAADSGGMAKIYRHSAAVSAGMGGIS